MPCATLRGTSRAHGSSNIYFGAAGRAVVRHLWIQWRFVPGGLQANGGLTAIDHGRCVWCSESGIAVGSSDLVKFTENHGASWVDRPTNLPFAGLNWHSVQYAPPTDLLTQRVT
jgi:hypothetical protein